jgi:hypothetical protein
VVAEVNAALAAGGMKAAAVNIHYLSTGLDVEVVLPAVLSGTLGSESGAPTFGRVDLGALKRRLGARKVDVLQELDASAAATGTTTEARTGAAINQVKAAEPHSTA